MNIFLIVLGSYILVQARAYFLKLRRVFLLRWGKHAEAAAFRASANNTNRRSSVPLCHGCLVSARRHTEVVLEQEAPPWPLLPPLRLVYVPTTSCISLSFLRLGIARPGGWTYHDIFALQSAFGQGHQRTLKGEPLPNKRRVLRRNCNVGFQSLEGG